jgi:acetyltransferase-like isoleucine patch superfamily enzyme/acyl carrier protein
LEAVPILLDLNYPEILEYVLGIRRELRFSNHWAAKLFRKIYYFPANFSLPCPRIVVRPIVLLFVALRDAVWFCQRIFIAEPFLKSYCTRYGKRLRTGKFIHWIQGTGEIHIGDDVTIDGKCSFKFAATYSARPQLIIGDHTGISHGCSFRIGKQVVIGKYCRLAGGVEIFDAPGHPNDPVARMAGEPAPSEDVRPVVIGDNVWIGRRTTIFPGVSIGDNAIVASNSAVFSDVPADTIVGGNPARVMGSAKERKPNNLFPDSMRALNAINADGLSALSEEVVRVICAIAKIQRLSSDQDFYDAGLSSMASLTLMLDLETKYKISLPDEKFVLCRTADQVSSLISDLLHPTHNGAV